MDEVMAEFEKWKSSIKGKNYVSDDAVAILKSQNEKVGEEFPWRWGESMARLAACEAAYDAIASLDMSMIVADRANEYMELLHEKREAIETARKEMEAEHQDLVAKVKRIGNAYAVARGVSHRKDFPEFENPEDDDKILYELFCVLKDNGLIKDIKESD